MTETRQQSLEPTVDDIDWDNLPPSTATEVAVQVRDFNNREAAKRLGEAVGDAVVTFGSFMDLSTLEGVTIAIDYDAALADIDQGIVGLRPLDRTNTDELQGVAKTCQVMRNGVVKSYLVFNAVMLVPLIANEASSDDDRKSAIGIIAHECAHVQINTMMEERVPDARLGAKIADFERSVLFPIAAIAWDEYAVCRLSARFARLQNVQHADTVETVLPGARSRANEQIKAYRLHGNCYRLVGEGGYELCQPIKAVSYLLGGMDADGFGWDAFPTARAVIEAGGYGALVDALHAACRTLWDSQSNWSADDDVLAPLVDLVRDTFASGGIHFYQDQSGEWGIKVPFSAETMPGS
jgi:hypothetical protein